MNRPRSVPPVRHHERAGLAVRGERVRVHVDTARPPAGGLARGAPTRRLVEATVEVGLRLSVSISLSLSRSHRLPRPRPRPHPHPHPHPRPLQIRESAARSTVPRADRARRPPPGTVPEAVAHREVMEVLLVPDLRGNKVSYLSPRFVFGVNGWPRELLKHFACDLLTRTLTYTYTRALALKLTRTRTHPTPPSLPPTPNSPRPDPSRAARAT